MDWENAIFGPGWVWSMLSMVLVVGSLVGLYRQLRLQASQSAIEQLDAVMRDFFSERMLRHQLEVLLAIQAGVALPNLPTGSSSAIANYFMKLGKFAHDGHIDPRLLETMGAITQAWWATLAPWCRRTWAEVGAARMPNDFEWLAATLGEMSRKAGATMAFDEAYLQGSLERRLAITRDMIGIEQSLRTVIIESPEAVPTVPSATVAAAEA